METGYSFSQKYAFPRDFPRLLRKQVSVPDEVIPAFDRIVIHLENGRDLTLRRKKDGKTAFRYGLRRLARPFLTHRELLEGRTLTYSVALRDL
jgi:hypothetical protein